jgi:hypothetical protein
MEPIQAPTKQQCREAYMRVMRLLVVQERTTAEEFTGALRATEGCQHMEKARRIMKQELTLDAAAAKAAPHAFREAVEGVRFVDRWRVFIEAFPETFAVVVGGCSLVWFLVVRRVRF